MLFDDPVTLVQIGDALKTTFDSVRSAIGMLREVRSLSGGTEQQQKAIDTALATASSSAAIAEAEVAKAFGYELCKCDFPPTPMKTVGYFSRSPVHHDGDPVYECPKCGYCNAGPYGYERIAPARVS